MLSRSFDRKIVKHADSTLSEWLFFFVDGVILNKLLFGIAHAGGSVLASSTAAPAATNRAANTLPKHANHDEQ
ncbi:hypothetical protein VTP01DRAFT_2164 [Rhizomucor pusillus]|uniref:uncharacterized protein n=1 Tax=Rhizomucor pusillus TaxID=4840 RepID=UPI00374200EA